MYDLQTDNSKQVTQTRVKKEKKHLFNGKRVWDVNHRKCNNIYCKRGILTNQLPLQALIQHANDYYEHVKANVTR